MNDQAMKELLEPTQPTEQLTASEYQRLLELVCTQRNLAHWQGLKEKLRILSESAPPQGNASLTTGPRETYGGGSLPSNIPSKEKP